MLCSIATNGAARCTLCSIALQSLICSLPRNGFSFGVVERCFAFWKAQYHLPDFTAVSLRRSPVVVHHSCRPSGAATPIAFSLLSSCPTSAHSLRCMPSCSAPSTRSFHANKRNITSSGIFAAIIAARSSLDSDYTRAPPSHALESVAETNTKEDWEEREEPDSITNDSHVFRSDGLNMWHVIRSTLHRATYSTHQETLAQLKSLALDSIPFFSSNCDAKPRRWTYSLLCRYVISVWCDTALKNIKRI